MCSISQRQNSTLSQWIVSVPLCETYKLSKGKSLIAYVKDASDEDAYKLFSDLLTYYETQYRDFESETQKTDIFGLPSSGAYRMLYQNCKGTIEKYRKPEPNAEIAKAVENSFSTEYMSQQIKLMLDNQETYPAEAIGKAKELVESCCRTILKIRNIGIEPDWKFHQLVGHVLDELNVIRYSTRNSIVHAKSNYEPNGLECPPDSLEEVNQMMSSIGRALIQWNENQADYIRV